MTTKRLFLFDALALAYRAYYAFINRPLTNAKGQNTSAIYGFLTFLNFILESQKPDYIAIAFDASAPTFRHKLYQDYKATRQKMPEDMATQIPILKEIIQAYNIPLLELDGYEADDILGTIAKKAEQNGIQSYLVTSDKDYMQLVSDSVFLFKPGRQGNKHEIITPESIIKRFGIEPYQIPDLFALTGDTSDNVPGVPGIGEKKALPLIQEFKTIENLYSNIDSIKQPKLRDLLIRHKDDAFRSKQLVTIDVNVPLSIKPHQLELKKYNEQELERLFKELNFKSFLSKLHTSDTSPSPENQQTDSTIKSIENDEHTYYLVNNSELLNSLIAILKNSRVFVFDTETTSTNPFLADLVGISFCTEQRKAFYIPVQQNANSTTDDLFQHTSTTNNNSLPLKTVIEVLKPLFENPEIKKIGHNIKYDILVLQKYNISVQGIYFDTMVANYLLRPDGRHSLDALAEEYLHYKTVTYKELTVKGKEQKLLSEIPQEQVSQYSCEDADITYRLYELLKHKLSSVGMENLFYNVEVPLITVLATMETNGVVIDVSYLEEMSKDLEQQLTHITQDIIRLAGTTFNINSSQQLSEVLFKTLKLKPVKKTKTGYSTDMAVLETLRNEHPIIELLLNYRQLSKLKSTYVDALPKLINPSTGKVHTSFNQTVTSTGRLSSSDPNLQNIPIRTEIGRAIRRAFIPSAKDNVLLSADYSQIELRVMAHISGDEGLRTAFMNGEDIHTTTAAKVFGVSIDDVNREMRRKAKEVNFGIMYGIGPYGLATRLEISQTEAKEIIEKYFERFPKVYQYINDTIATARTQGYVTTLLGRRRYLPDINSRNQTIRQNAERQAINMPIQGSAADMIKLAMIQIADELIRQQLRSMMILQVHDELVFDVPTNELSTVRKIVTHCMQTALKLNVPVIIEIGYGKNWLDAH